MLETYGAKLVPHQVGLHWPGYQTELSNLVLVGASAGYPRVPGVINNGMNVMELITGVAIKPVAAPSTTFHSPD